MKKFNVHGATVARICRIGTILGALLHWPLASRSRERKNRRNQNCTPKEQNNTNQKMQNQRTLQFWDEYYSTQEKDAQEWILEPIIELLDKLMEHLPPRKSTPIRILEIGCGTSVLARELWKLLIQRNIDAHILATDISPVCIQFNRQRDTANIPSGLCDDRMQYGVLNAAEQQPSFENNFDIILDKGCLDTFAFRSRQRGHSQPYAPLIRAVLNNIHAWLKDDGVYWVLTPRQKLRSVRDFKGFQSVQRVDLTAMQRAELVSQKEHTYLHVCCKNMTYSPHQIENAFDLENDCVDDTSSCTTCKMTFFDFRKGELLDGRGEAVWKRQWKGHCRHCKGTLR